MRPFANERFAARSCAFAALKIVCKPPLLLIHAGTSAARRERVRRTAAASTARVSGRRARAPRPPSCRTAPTPRSPEASHVPPRSIAVTAQPIGQRGKASVGDLGDQSGDRCGDDSFASARADERHALRLAAARSERPVSARLADIGQPSHRRHTTGRAAEAPNDDHRGERPEQNGSENRREQRDRDSRAFPRSGCARARRTPRRQPARRRPRMLQLRGPQRIQQQQTAHDA